MDAQPRWWRWSLFGLALVGTVVVARLGGNDGYYNLDELVLWHQMADERWFAWEWFVPTDSPFFRPLGYAAFRTQLGLGGGDPAWVHWISVLHHGVNLGLLGLLLHRLNLPWLAAVLAMVLPTCLPGVAWVAAVYDRLAMTWLSVAALAMTLRGAACLVAVPAVALALLTKETTVVFVVPAWLLWQWRGASRDRVVRATAMGITVLIAGFVAWRLLAAQQVPEYRLAVDAEVPTRLARYLAFPFAVGAEDPRTVWGWRWVGLLGTAAWLAIAWRGAPRLLVAGVLVWLAPVGLIALLPKIEGHYLYLSTPGFALITAAALRSRMRRALLPLVAVAFVHGWQVATFYLRNGDAMQALGDAHATLPPTPDPVDCVVAPGGRIGIAERFATYLEQVGRRPGLRIRASPTTPVWVELTADQDVVVHPR